MTWPNPFVRLYEAPAETLTVLAYALVLLAVTVALAGVAWRAVLRTYLYVDNRHAESFGGRWRYVPPLRLVGLVGGTLFLLAVEAALLAALAYLL